MTDETADLILSHLRAIRGDTARIESKVDALTLSVASLELAVAGLGKQVAKLIDGPTENDNHH
jgi:hypothetical protein